MAVLVLVEGMLETLLVDASWDQRAEALVMVGPIAAGVALRRRTPLLALALALSGLIASDAMPKSVFDNVEGPFFALLFVVYSMAAQCDGWRLVLGVAMAEIGMLLGVGLDPGDNSPSDFLFGTLLVVVAPVAAGQLLRSRVSLNRALVEKAEQLERDRTGRAEEAVLEERTRIAGELHDVIAHALGAMTVQAAAARRLVEKDPARAKTAFEAVETTGRVALGELRTLLGVLRHGDSELALSPQPRLASVADLVRHSELPAELSVEGEPDAAVPTGVDVTAFRVVQEALREAASAGGARRALVKVRYQPGAVEIAIVDDGVVDGRRLLGMRERVRVYGGELSAGPRRGGGHEVRARLPLEVAQ